MTPGIRLPDGSVTGSANVVDAITAWVAHAELLTEQLRRCRRGDRQLQQFDGPYGLHYFDPQDVILLSAAYDNGRDERKWRRVWIRGIAYGEIQIWDDPSYLERILR